MAFKPEVIETDYLERAQRERGVNFDLHPAKRVVITGFSAITPFGDASETWEKYLTNVSSTRRLDLEEHLDTKIGSLLPEDYDPYKRLHPEDEKLGLSYEAASGIHLVREAFIMASLMQAGERYINPQVLHPYEISTTASTGMGAADQIIDIHDYTVRGRGSKIPPNLALQSFIEEPPARIAMAVGYSGRRNSTTVEACATSLSSVVLGYDILKQGYAKAVVVGGCDNLMQRHPNETVANFSSLKALSKRNNDPELASRPYDVNRDGFVLSSGGGYAILENEEYARARGANILAEVVGVAKGLDGNAISFDAKKVLTTEMDPQRVADIIAETVYVQDSNGLFLPDVYAAHATSTKGDKLEAKALALVFGERLADIFITANKSRINHTLGAAGILNLIMAIQMMSENKIPSILNLENPDPEIDSRMNYVRDSYREHSVNSVLIGGFGFGRYSAAALVTRYNP